MSTIAGRRYHRHPVHISGSLLFGRKTLEVVTEDVSRAGLRVRTDAPPPEKVLVRLNMPLPPDGVPITLAGITAHVSLPGGPKVPGVGILLYGNSKELLGRWYRFLDYLRLSQAAPESDVPVAAPYNDPVRRRFERVQAVLQVRCRSVTILETLATRDVSQGGLFLTTNNPHEVGQELGLEVVHPETGALFPLQAVVRRVVKEAEMTGMGVEILTLNEVQRREFWEFVRSGIPSLDEDDLELMDVEPGLEELFDEVEV